MSWRGSSVYRPRARGSRPDDFMLRPPRLRAWRRLLTIAWIAIGFADLAALIFAISYLNDRG